MNVKEEVEIALVFLQERYEVVRVHELDAEWLPVGVDIDVHAVLQLNRLRDLSPCYVDVRRVRLGAEMSLSFSSVLACG